MNNSIKITKTLTQFTFYSLISVLISCGSAQKLTYNSQDQSQCETKNGYWYNNKCWKDFEDEGIPNSKIDSTVIAEMKVISQSTFVIDNQTYPLIAFLPIEEKEGMLLLTVYGTQDNYNSLIFLTGKKNIKNGIFQSPVTYLKGDVLSEEVNEKSALKGTATINVIDLDKLNIEIKGKIMSKDSTRNFAFTSNESISGAGNSHIEIKGKEAYLSGDLGTKTYVQIKDLIKNHPEIKTIVMTKISGSVNDAVNMHTGRLLHENGFTTKVLARSDIASGGVDLFCAGVNRIVEKGAKIGVHSWCCVNGLTAIEIPKDHPAHQYQLEYFTMILGPENGPAFYFYTLEASPFDNVHYMTDEEIKKWNIATQFIENE
jgi:hypothetical protein